MNNNDDSFFEKLPKMTNNHIHLFALYPYKDFLQEIEKIDPELYNRIYVLKEERSLEQVNQVVEYIKNNKKEFSNLDTQHKIKKVTEHNPKVYADLVNSAHRAKINHKIISKNEFKSIFRNDPSSYHMVVDIIKKRDLLSSKEREYSYQLNRYTFNIFNENNEGISYVEITSKDDWIQFSNIKEHITQRFYIDQHDENPFDEFEKIQKMFKIFIRNYKIYYYFWYLSLCKNFNDRIFYLNVRGKPGTITRDVKFGQRLYLETNNVRDIKQFNNRIIPMISTDAHIKPSDLKFLYREYKRIKTESDLILKAVHDFNKEKKCSSYRSDDELLNITAAHTLKPNLNYQSDPFDINSVNMMVQYIITFPKTPKSVPINIPNTFVMVKIALYAAALINEDYGFNFFNGIDFVGNEQESHDLEEFAPVFIDILSFQKYGIKLIPHIGETNIIKNNMTLSERYILNNKVIRIGHGLSFITTEEIRNFIKKDQRVIYLEICPMSNYILDYFDPEDHPAKIILSDENLKIVICSDDNGLFNYFTVSTDYKLVYKKWNIGKKELKNIIQNGLNLIDIKYRDYYNKIFNQIWSTEGFETISA